MGKNQKKSKSAEQKARVAAKQSKKSAQKEKKGKAKGVDDSDAEDVDLERVLEDYAKKNYIILFGGFQDTSQQTKYLQDLWIYDCQKFVWYTPTLSVASQKPDARSSFSFHPHENGAVIYGGYSRVKSNVQTRQGKGASQANKSSLKPMIHEDTWFLRIKQPANDEISAQPQVRWHLLSPKERRKKPANPPSPPRAGATQAFHKGRGIMFGGVFDIEDSEEGIESQFFDQLYTWNVERNRFFQLSLRRSRAKPAKKKTVEDRPRRGRGRADENELFRNLVALEQKGTIEEADTMQVEVLEEDKEEARPAKPVLDVMPHRRFNAHLAIQGDVLYILGGTFEQGDREYTFDEMYSIDLGKLDGVHEIYRRDLENWQGDEEMSESESDEESSSEDENMGGDEAEGVPLPESEFSKPQYPVEMESDVTEDEAMDERPQDERPHPRPFESLREFFSRTSGTWQQILIDHQRDQGRASEQSIKELRKIAFEDAETKWWDCREEITTEEERQEEAGIEKVVSLADRSKDGVGIGKRR
ncbi:uncharacterized protein KY384_002578 [Bacidia gigantensis]|uniref:uncharacterized protein n=1 Tax=Bacidia gigantensis TaxID=2732470 RepID=UPI001D036105|nr:uncharacterized protein KY384_002578 [Bacidia gigantensis]KAG8532701.1 hypothetical protein KY384_002578 [Bacidia gigantensis]